MDDILASTSSSFDLNVGAGLTGTDGYGLSGALENHQLLATPLSRSRATNLTNLEIQNLLAEPTIVEIAQGSSMPSKANYPATVTNGDFLLQGNSIATLVGDGVDESTTWTFDFTKDPDFTSLSNSTLLASAQLTLTLKPTDGLITTDGITIQGLGSIVQPIRELPVNETSTVTIDLLDYFSPDIVLQSIQRNAGKFVTTYQDDAIVSFTALELFTFDSGIFTVGNTGQVGIDFLFDDGGYQGELALFSLKGMGQYNPGSVQFIQEAARRALSNSTLGHLVISDLTEAARFSGKFDWEDDFNAGIYQGSKVFDFTPGDRFGVMLVPNGSVQQVFDNPTLETAIRPLFSISTANPLDAFHLEQIADLTGDGNTFVFEDLRLDDGSDLDYNDIVFQVRGAIGDAPLIDGLIDPAKDWRNSDIGELLVDYTAQTWTDTQLEAVFIDLTTSSEQTLVKVSANLPADVQCALTQIEQVLTEEITDPVVIDRLFDQLNQLLQRDSKDISVQLPQVLAEFETLLTDLWTDLPPEFDRSELEAITAQFVAEIKEAFAADDGFLASPTYLMNQGDHGTAQSNWDLLPSDRSALNSPLINQPLIGIIDTGFSANNPDFDYARMLLGRDRLDDDDDPLLIDQDDDDHGTHVLGIIAATQANNFGIDGWNDDAPLWLGRAVGSGKWAESLVEFVN